MGRVELTLNEVVKAIRKIEKLKFYPEFQDLCAHLKRNPSVLHNFNIDFRRLGIWGLALPTERGEFEALTREFVRFLQSGDPQRQVSIRDLADVLCIKDAHSFERKARELGVDLAQFPLTIAGIRVDQKVRPGNPFFKKYQCVRRKYVQELGVRANHDFSQSLRAADSENLKGALIRLKRIRGKNNPLLIEYYRAHLEHRPVREKSLPRPREFKFIIPELPIPVTSRPVDTAEATHFREEINAALHSLQAAGQLRYSYRIEFHFEASRTCGSKGLAYFGWRTEGDGFSQTIAFDNRALPIRIKDVLDDLLKKVTAEEGSTLRPETCEPLKWKYLRRDLQVQFHGDGASPLWDLQFHVRDTNGNDCFCQTLRVTTPAELCESLRQWKKKGLLPLALAITYTDYTFSSFQLRGVNGDHLLVRDLSDPRPLQIFLNH